MNNKGLGILLNPFFLIYIFLFNELLKRLNKIILVCLTKIKKV